jgi:hypothetical protein
MKKIMQCGLALTVLATLFVTSAEAEDPIAAWNEISEAAVKTAGHAPPVAALDFAIVHLAIYDAVESIDRRYVRYHALVPGATGSLSAAAAKAGHDVLVGLFPAQSATLDADYANFLAANGIDPLDPGTAVGAQAAADILTLRSNDGRFLPNQVPFLRQHCNRPVEAHPLFAARAAAIICAGTRTLGGQRHAVHYEEQLAISR